VQLPEGQDGKTHSPTYTVSPMIFTDVVPTQSSCWGCSALPCGVCFEVGFGGPSSAVDGRNADGNFREMTCTKTGDETTAGPLVSSQWWRVNFQRQVC
jgi:hypothetical protein